MTPFGHIRFAAKSDVGRKRKNNEDSFGVFPSCGVFCVADGMGGGDDGEVASAATVEAVREFCELHPLPPGRGWRMDDWLDGVSTAVSKASAWINSRTRERGLKDCGSTFVGLCFDPSHPSVAMAIHAGDSRLYLLRGHGIRQITKDHSVAEMIGVKNEKEVNPLFRGMILRAVGIQPAVDLERTMFDIKKGDRIILCSDGLSKMLPDKRIEAIARGKKALADAAEALVEAANEAGGSDNITVVIVEVGTLPTAIPVVPVPDCPAHDEDSREDEDSADTVSESDTRETGETMQMTECFGKDCIAMPPSRKRCHRLSARHWIALVATLVLLGACGLFGCLIWHRFQTAAAEESVRKAELSATVMEISRQAAEKDRKRAAEAESLRAEDIRQGQQVREKERRRFQGNVDLPVE